MTEKFWMLLPADAERGFGMSSEERAAITRHFPDRHSLTVHDIPPGHTVIPRFRSIPFGKEMQAEVELHGSTLVNSYHQHRNIANLYNWVHLLDGYTAPAYKVHDIPNLPDEGEWFVKGETNSVKNRWFDFCYADSKQRLIEVVRNNQMDGWVGSQEIVIRPFEHYRQVATAVDGRAVTNEWRVFILDGEVLSEGFYWSSFADDVPVAVQQGLIPGRRQEAVEAVLPLVADLARFIVVDFAETPDGDWRVIELNDGCMSGISENDPDRLWSQFA